MKIERREGRKSRRKKVKNIWSDRVMRKKDEREKKMRGGKKELEKRGKRGLKKDSLIEKNILARVDFVRKCP